MDDNPSIVSEQQETDDSSTQPIGGVAGEGEQPPLLAGDGSNDQEEMLPPHRDLGQAEKGPDEGPTLSDET